MSKSGQAYVAATEGTDFTMYSIMRAMGIPLSEEQAKFQAYLESRYPPVSASTMFAYLLHKAVQRDIAEGLFNKEMDTLRDMVRAVDEGLSW